jgi:hypothetical protein
VVLSPGSEFIGNADAAGAPGKSALEVTQDGERKALCRLLGRIEKDYPQLRFVLALDNWYACGPVFALAQPLRWSFVVTFEEGRTPALWRQFQARLPQCPADALRRT